ncbi:MAG: CDP-glycerol glycerophosphotransferase family protein [Microlunatus sp.]|nr:CDP-glycerol glycerophosphotransferase family protein [Microlunatus sp.]MDN5770897.1 CDP-glycerol glycerophosphotransferase family protein [Microlunatus sp.]
MAALRGARRYPRAVRERVSNLLRARRFSAETARRGPVPDDAVALFLAVGPENAYQFEQWRRPLEALATRRAVLVIVDRPDTGRLVAASSTLPIAFARSSGELERLVQRHRIRAVLYANQVEQNFRMLRFAAPVHIQIGHGESDKGGSVSNQHKAYDCTFIGGEAGRQRLAEALFDFDADQRTRLVGRPQLDHDYPGAPEWSDDGRLRVLYAPTWEGDRPSIRYGSVVSHGTAMIAALRADERVRIIYRPHPRIGQASAAHAAADRTIRAALAGDGDRHLLDRGTYGWQWEFADYCLTDVSAVAYDWLATGKPLAVTEPAPEAYRPPSPLLDALDLVPASRAGDIRVLLPARSSALAALTRRYFGETADRSSTRRFEAALTELIDRRERDITGRTGA